MEKVNAKDFLGKEVSVEIDRPLGTRHPKHGFMYMLNYGFNNFNQSNKLNDENINCSITKDDFPTDIDYPYKIKNYNGMVLIISPDIKFKILFIIFTP